MSKYLDAECQCTLLNDGNCIQRDNSTTTVINSDDDDKNSLSSLFNMFGIKHAIIPKKSIDKKISISPLTKRTTIKNIVTPPLRTRVPPLNIVTNKKCKLPIDKSKTNFVPGSLLSLTPKLPEYKTGEYITNSWDYENIETPVTPNGYQHPWL